MYCTKCGAKLPRDAKFCMNCGKPVSAIVFAKAVELKASPANAAVPTKVVEPTAAPLGRNDVSSSDASSNGSSLESAAFVDEPENHARPAHAMRLRHLKAAPRQSVPKRCAAR